MVPISKGTLVSVEPKTRRGRPNSEGGFGTVTKKKRRKQDKMAPLRRRTPDTAATEISGISSIVAAARPTLTEYSTAWLLLESDKKTATGERKIIIAMQHKKKSEKGWLRNLEFSIDPVSAPNNFTTDSAIKLHLTEAEKEKAIKVLIAAKPHDSAIPLVAYAWGVTENTLRNWYNSMIYSNGTTVKRKQRSDAGKTLITSDKKRQSIYTPYFVFAKLLRKENPDQSYSAADIKSAWLTASQETKARCSEQAAQWIQQGPFLLEEIDKALSSTAGSASWTQVATLVSGTGNLEIISDRTIRQFVMSLPESS